MHGGDLFLQALLFLGAAVVTVPIAKRLGLGSVLGYLIAGALIGPHVLQWTGDVEDVMGFAEFGVVMMLFVIGLELEPRALWRMRGPILGTGGLQLLFTTLVIAGTALLCGLGWQASLAIGLFLSLSSTAIVLQTLDEKGWRQLEGGRRSFSVLLFQDIAVIPMLALIPLLAVGSGKAAPHAADQGHHGPPSLWIDLAPSWAQAPVTLLALATIFFGGRLLARFALCWIAKAELREAFTAATLFLVVAIALLMVQLGLSPALGTFLAGVVLADSEYRHELESDIEPFKGLLLGLFFLTVGASINFPLIAEKPVLILGLTLGLMVVKFGVLFLISGGLRMGNDQRLLLAFSLAQAGEFGFVLFSLAQQNGVLEAALADPLVAVIALSMALTPLAFLLYEKVLQPHLGTKVAEGREADEMEEEEPVIIAGFGRFGHPVGRLLRAQGIGTTVLEFDSDHVELLRDLGLKVFYGDAGRVDLLAAAGAEKARALIIAINKEDKCMELVENARKHFPQLKIFARACSRDHAYRLVQEGVEQIYVEQLGSSLDCAQGVMEMLGYSEERAKKVVARFRRHEEEALRSLSEVRHNRADYIDRARKQIQDITAIMREDESLL
ncbi:MAG: monovalent cation:proton antiporter-2 (CPA2) family protein [Verrucomicrobiota bacterium]